MSTQRTPAPESPPLADDRTAEMLARAEDAYFQFSRADNEAAIDLYTRVLGLNPDDANAMAGLANALAQRVFRWGVGAGAEGEQTRALTQVVAAGELAVEPALSQLARAEQLARRAVTLAPQEAATHKALGLVRTAQGDFDEALASYQRSLELDPDAWAPMLNMGEILGFMGQSVEALRYYEAAYNAMETAYSTNAIRIRPWQGEIGVLIADRYQQSGNTSAAEVWYRRVLEASPLQPKATRGLASLLRTGGDADEAARLCAELEQRLGASEACQ